MPPFIHYDPAGLGRGFAGGIVIAASTSFLLATTGLTGGISGILGGFPRGDVLRWRLAFLVGLLVAGGVLVAVPDATEVYGTELQVHWAVSLVGGLLTGFGTRLAKCVEANWGAAHVSLSPFLSHLLLPPVSHPLPTPHSSRSGCTSGHGIVGLARLSPRSLVAVLTFMGAAVVAAGLSRAPFARAHLYGATSGMPSPTADWTWTLTPEVYVAPLAAAVAAVLILRFAVALEAQRKHVRPAQTPAADEDNGCEVPSGVADGAARKGNGCATPTAAASSESSRLVSAGSAAKMDKDKATPLVSEYAVDAQGHRLAKPSSWATIAAAQSIVFFSGLAFGLGLGLSGMTSPNKVRACARGCSTLPSSRCFTR
jgi:uncharacterized protein